MESSRTVLERSAGVRRLRTRAHAAHWVGVPRLLLTSLTPFDAFVLLFILAGMALRLWQLDAMEFKSDEFTHMLAAYRAQQGPWSAPLLPSEGTTVSPGIFFYQLLAVPASITLDPVSVARFIALVNIFSIPALYLLVRQLFAHRVALWATALFATAPWMLVFSRKIWNPDLLIPFLIITLFFLLAAMRRYTPWKVYAFAFSLALLSQLHLSVWLALFPLLPLGLFFRPWRRPFDLAMGVAIFFGVSLLILGPRTGDFLAALAGATADRPDTGLRWLVGHNALWSVRLATGSGFEYLLGPEGFASFARSTVVSWARATFLLYAILAGAACGYVASRMVHAAKERFQEVSDRFLLVLILMGVSLHTAYLALRIASFPHYQVVLLLLPPVAVALLLVWLDGRFGTAGTCAARAILVVVLAANISFGAAFSGFVSARPESIDGDYGRPYSVDRQRWEEDLSRALGRIDRSANGSQQR